MKSNASSDMSFASGGWHAIYAKLLQFTHDAVLIREPGGTIVYWNRGAEALYGYTSAEALGQISHELLRPSQPEGMPASEHLRDDWWDGELTHTTKDGRTIFVESRQATVEDGGRTFILETNRDITERKLSEQRIDQLRRDLQQKLDELQTVLQVLPVGLAIAEDPECKRMTVNPALGRLLGVPTGANASLSAPPEERPYYTNFLNGREVPPDELPMQVAAAKGQEVRDWEVDMVRADGAVTRLLCYARPLFDKEGRVHGSVGAFLDITERKRAEEQAQWLAFMMEATPDFVALSRSNGTIVYMNKAGRRLVGLAEEADVTRMRHSDLCPRWVYERTRREWMPIALRDGTALGEGALCTLDGREIPVSFVLLIHRNAAGEVEFISTIARDITERQRAEAALRESEEHLRYTVELNPQVPWTATPDGAIDNFNQRWLDMTGLTREQALGDGWKVVPHPDDLARMVAAWTHTIQAGEPHDLEHRIRLADGTYRWMRSRAYPRRDEQGRIVRWYGSTEDIHERKLTEETLRESEARFRHLAESNLFGVAFGDLVGGIYYANDAFLQMIGYTHEDLAAGRVHWIEMTPPEYLHLDERAVQELLARGAATPFEKEYIRKDGSRVPILIGSALMPRRPGRPDEAVAFYVDLSERKQAEEALKEADRRKDEFLAMLAHELRNPLAPILNAVEVLKRIGPPDAQLNQMRDTIERQVMHLARLVDDLLDVSRITQNKITLRKERLELMTVVGRAVETSRHLIDARRHHLTVSLPSDPTRIEGDLTRLAQVLSNLLNNAAKYTDEGGHIQLVAQRTGDEIVIQVKDDGMGIPPDMLPHVFDLFMQADRSLDRSQGGLGIGLTLVRRIVEMHGGRVEAFSEGPGKGSEFRVHLPILTDEAQPEAPARAPSPGAVAARSCRVLVVDDSMDSAESVALVLQFGGHETRLAHNGPAALEVARTFRPQVVLLDIGLPGMDGYEVARRLRDLPESKKAFIIALTGYGRPEDRKRALSAGCNHHLTKPVNPRELETLIGTVIQDLE